MKELYADFNDIAADGSLPLTCRGSVESIDALGVHDGEQVWLTDGELRVRAQVVLALDGTWEAHSQWTFCSRA